VVTVTASKLPSQLRNSLVSTFLFVETGLWGYALAGTGSHLVFNHGQWVGKHDLVKDFCIDASVEAAHENAQKTPPTTLRHGRVING
jgi:hypothetical protein